MQTVTNAPIDANRPLPCPRRRIRHHRACASCAMLVACLGAQAQDGSGNQRVHIQAHYLNDLGSSDASSAGIISAQLIEDRPLLRPGALLEYVPGMVVTQHSGAGKANQYFLRGFNLDHGTDFATWVAGMPVKALSNVV